MAECLFTLPDTWNGGFYSLAFEVGERSDTRLFAVLRSIWKHPSVNGCYLLSDKEPSQQKKIAPTLKHIQSGFHLHGIATLPNESLSACGTVAIREDSGIDWLVLYLPMGALVEVYKAVDSFPFIDNVAEHEEWRTAIETWFHDIAQHICKHSHFKLGLIGFEVSGNTYSKRISANRIPEERYMGYLWETDGILGYYPRNRG